MFAVLFLFAVGLVLAELVLGIADVVRDGKLIHPQEKVRALANANQQGGGPLMSLLGEQCRWVDMFRSHPYFMYAKKSSGACADSGVNRQGYVGPEYPLKRLEKTFTILLTGGSVAEDLMWRGPVTTLEAALNSRYRIDGFDGFKVIVGAIAGGEAAKPIAPTDNLQSSTAWIHQS